MCRIRITLVGMGNRGRQQDYNLLICSDLHLGGTLRGEDVVAAHGKSLPFGVLRRAVKHDRAVAAFLDYHRLNRASDGQGTLKPWRLIFNGDIFDFLHVDVMPTAENGAPSEEETVYGLTFAENRSCWKMGVISQVHRHTFEALARFVDAGHECVFVLGNHDVDLWFEKVRQAFLDALELVSTNRSRIREAIHFEPWFHYEPGRIYVEHGHRFDPYNTFPDPLQPIVVTEERQLAPTFGHFSLRYFCNRVRSFPIYDMDKEPVSKILKWVIGAPKKEVAFAFGYWLYFLWKYFTVNVWLRKETHEMGATLRHRRREKLRGVATRTGLSLKNVLALDRLRRRHVGASFSRLAQSMQLDIIALTLAVVAGVSLSVSSLDGLLALCGSLTSILTGVFMLTRLNRTRPIVDVQPVLGKLARRIGKLTRTKVVVFGHTHKATIETNGGVQWINPGSWEHLPYTASHEHSETCGCALKYGVFVGGRKNDQIYLFDWCAVNAEPIGAEQPARGRFSVARAQLSRGVGSLHSRFDHILSGLRNRPRHVTTLRNRTQVAESEMR